MTRGYLSSGERASLDSDLAVPRVCCAIVGKFRYLYISSFFFFIFLLKMGMVLLAKVIVKIRDNVCNALRLIGSKDFIIGN